MVSIRKNIEKAVWHAKYFGFKRLVYSAGMPRSGSTLLFNIIRLIMQTRYTDNLSFGWIEEMDKLSAGEAYLIKTHHLNRMMTWRAFKTYYSFRDIRNVLVSRQNKFKKEPNIEIVRYYISQDQKAKSHADLIFKYEVMKDQIPDVVKDISGSLNIEVDENEIIRMLPDPKKVNVEKNNHSEETLLHRNHVTGTKEKAWKKALDKKLIDQIHDEFGWWLEENNYCS